MRKKELLLRRLNANGQLYLDKQLAGSLVNVIAREPGVWEIRQVPAHETWLHTPATAAALERATAWALTHPPTVSDISTRLPADSDAPSSPSKDG